MLGKTAGGLFWMYRYLERAENTATNIADFLILNGRMPRSLAFCYEKINSNLTYLEREYGKRHAAHETAAAILERLRAGEIRAIMDAGLHEFLQDFIGQNSRVAAEIAEAYRFYQD
jgi:uncharacterized alpha-E superfamily protein